MQSVKAKAALPCITLVSNAVSCVSLLIAAKSDLESIGSGGNTPILMTSQRENWEVVELLIHAGADVNVVDPDSIVTESVRFRRVKELSE